MAKHVALHRCGENVIAPRWRELDGIGFGLATPVRFDRGGGPLHVEPILIILDRADFHSRIAPLAGAIRLWHHKRATVLAKERLHLCGTKRARLHCNQRQHCSKATKTAAQRCRNLRHFQRSQ